MPAGFMQFTSIVEIIVWVRVGTLWFLQLSVLFCFSHGHYKTPSVQAPSAVGDLITVAIVGLIIYAFYKTCLSGSSRDPGDDDDDSPYRGQRGYGGGYGGPGGNPPPYGFRDDMTGGGCRN